MIVEICGDAMLRLGELTANYIHTSLPQRLKVCRAYPSEESWGAVTILELMKGPRKDTSPVLRAIRIPR